MAAVYVNNCNVKFLKQTAQEGCCSSMAIVLMDRMDGDFSLEIDFIGVCHDRTHYEEFAYETYAVPIFNTKGI